MDPLDTLANLPIFIGVTLCLAFVGCLLALLAALFQSLLISFWRYLKQFWDDRRIPKGWQPKDHQPSWKRKGKRWPR